MPWAPHFQAKRQRQVPDAAVIERLYEIYTQRGYVDDRDWNEAAEQLSKEQQAGLRTSSRPLAAPSPKS